MVTLNVASIENMDFIGILWPQCRDAIKWNIQKPRRMRRNLDEMNKPQKLEKTLIDMKAPTIYYAILTIIHYFTMIGCNVKLTQRYQRHWYIVALICLINLQFGGGSLVQDDNKTFEILGMKPKYTDQMNIDSVGRCE